MGKSTIPMVIFNSYVKLPESKNSVLLQLCRIARENQTGKGPAASVLAAVESFGSLQLPPTNPPSVPSKVIMMIPAWAMGKTFGNHGGLFFACYILLKSH
jgi:hypothetical protein